MNRDDRNAAPNDPPDDEQTAVDLRRSICDVSDRIAQLKAERSALEESRDNLEVYERDLVQRLATARTGPADRTARAEAAAARVHEIDAETAALRHEISALERMCRANVRRLEGLSREAAALGGELHAQRGEVSAAETSLQLVQEAIVRMGRKLLFAQRKHSRGAAASDSER